MIEAGVILIVTGALILGIYTTPFIRKKININKLDNLLK